MEPKAKTINDYLDIAKQCRKWSLIIPAIVVFLGACVVARYCIRLRDDVNEIRIEEQDVPVDFKTAVTSYAEQQIQTIYQRIMNFSRLREMIDSFNLYPALKKRWNIEQIVVKMREDITLELTGSDVLGKRSRRRNENAVAFTISYQGQGSDGRSKGCQQDLVSVFR